MKRLVRIKTDFIIEIDDDTSGIPFVKDPLDFFQDGLSAIPHHGGRITSILPGGRLAMSLIKIVNGKLRGVTLADMRGRTVKKPDRRAKERRQKPRRTDDKRLRAIGRKP